MEFTGSIFSIFSLRSRAFAVYSKRPSDFDVWPIESVPYSDQQCHLGCSIPLGFDEIQPSCPNSLPVPEYCATMLTLSGQFVSSEFSWTVSISLCPSICSPENSFPSCCTFVTVNLTALSSISTHFSQESNAALSKWIFTYERPFQT